MIGAKSSMQRNLVIILAGICLCYGGVVAKSRIPITENEIREKKNDCFVDIGSGLWGENCKSSEIAKENCALRCVSPDCYELIYGSDPLEVGERDFIRSSEFKYCVQRQSVGESIDGVRGAFGN